MKTAVQEISVKSILTPASGYMDTYDYTLSPYLGCSYGCSYCYVPTLFSHRREAASWGESLKVKVNAPALLRRAAERGKVAGKRIYLSPATDPYVPQERTYQLTHQLLEIFCAYPPALLVMQTRSLAVLHDLPLLRQLRERLVVGLSITTDAEAIRQLFERRSPKIPLRVEALATLHDNGIRTQASLAPLLPCDPEHLAQLVAPHADWVVVQALKRTGPGARTWGPALDLLRAHGYEDWLERGPAVDRAMATLRAFFGTRYHEGREGFSVQWLQSD